MKIVWVVDRRDQAHIDAGLPDHVGHARVLEMRATFRKHRKRLTAVAIVATKPG